MDKRVPEWKRKEATGKHEEKTYSNFGTHSEEVDILDPIRSILWIESLGSVMPND